MIGKIRLGKNTKIDGENETIVYPSTAFMTKKTKKKKKKLIVNNIMIEDLHLEDVNNDDQDSVKTKKSKISKISAGKTIKNAFYN
jgi:DNA helicase TIP49 (TBP-interacting protein)